ncbi:hypothetical protein SAMN05444358_101717 [Ruegeria halocynthiae]|uniref:Uncharacterized protein n=1 Tax=Ruegeria halocynthiae TaxID=985054 RepID=A0A1H2T9A9_9RHOB|nr:hypothetical protein [Ruegeria halocynthiae]SDW39874.1 hypothetical protein SAMN05444358_101717 [Ruegeria halocynthiae]
MIAPVSPLCLPTFRPQALMHVNAARATVMQMNRVMTALAARLNLIVKLPIKAVQNPILNPRQKTMAAQKPAARVVRSLALEGEVRVRIQATPEHAIGAATEQMVAC